MPDKDMVSDLRRAAAINLQDRASAPDAEAEGAHGYAGVLQALGQSDA